MSDADTHRTYLFNPWLDFFLLGGGSLILLPLAFSDVFRGKEPLLLATSYMIADVINHPHFAASYVIFYRQFLAQVQNKALSLMLRWRYLWAGVLMPVTLISYFAYSVLTKQEVLLGLAFNAMAFLVGWHYTKQGYGIMIVDSVMKRRFLTKREKNVLLINGFTFWLLTWCLGNQYVYQSQYWGVEYFTFALPKLLFTALLVAACVTGIAAFIVLLLRVRKGGIKALAWTGVSAYVISTYMWLGVLFSPVLIYFIPAFHSLQYLTVVYRYELNRTKKRTEQVARRYFKIGFFFALTTLIGYLGFWFLPRYLNTTITPDTALVFGSAVFLFMFWIFINIHHYFIDNVIWKSENKDVKENLFS
jgi:hypothetical protein